MLAYLLRAAVVPIYNRWRRIPAIALDYSRNRYRDVIILKPRDANFAVDNKKREKMFDDFDYDNYGTESTNEGFFMAYNEKNGQEALGASPDEAIRTLAEEEQHFFMNEDFDDFDF